MVVEKCNDFKTFFDNHNKVVTGYIPALVLANFVFPTKIIACGEGFLNDIERPMIGGRFQRNLMGV